MEKNMEPLRVGDTVLWRGTWGRDRPKKAVVVGMEVTTYPREKDGYSVEEVGWEVVREDRVVLDLGNGHWAYGSQIAPAKH